MAIVSVLTENNEAVDQYIELMKERMSSNSVLLNPFKTAFKTAMVNHNGKEVYQLNLLLIEPVYPNVSVLGWFGAVSWFWLWGWSGWIIPFIIVGLLGVFWSKYFYTLIFYLGIRKAGYSGRYKMLTTSDALGKLID